MTRLARYKRLFQSACLNCEEFLCAMAGEYSGDVQCPSCGEINVFEGSSWPTGVREAGNVRYTATNPEHRNTA